MNKNHDLDDMKTALKGWEQENEKEFERERKDDFEFDCGIPIRRLYTPLDLMEKGFNYLKDLGFPGAYPYTLDDAVQGKDFELTGIEVVGQQTLRLAVD